MPIAPKEAASVILIRPAAPFEVLLVARSATSRVMGGFWVFPGGRVEPTDGHGVDSMARAALRELYEETGVQGLQRAQLLPFARWISPVSLRVRFDTLFFLARAPIGTKPGVDGLECTAAQWWTPQHALLRAAEGEVPLVFPTRKQLERLSGFASIGALFADTSGRAVETVTPRFRCPGDRRDPLLPGDHGYDQATG